MENTFNVNMEIIASKEKSNFNVSVSDNQELIESLSFYLDNISIDKDNRIMKMSQLFSDIGMEIARKINLKEELQNIQTQYDKKCTSIDPQKY